MISYISTRGSGDPQNFEQVLLAGLAPDGGLYVPLEWPKLDIKSLKGKSYIEIAEAVMFPFVEGSISQGDFRKILEETYGPENFRASEITPLYKAEGNIYVLELFHGPTIAFKDIALQLLGRLFDHVLKKNNQRVTIVGATSGDTGSAAIEGCRHSENVDIFILFPEGRVSEVQRRQMTTVQAPNVHNIALQGTFDDCQAAVKAMFNDAEFRTEMNLSAVNSINWARIMAQIVYYVHAALALGAPEEEISFVVPTGNFGNVFAAYAAKQMGMPVKTLGIATNKNDILTRFFETGAMKKKGVSATISPSMDIEISSNFERYLFDLIGRDSKTLAEMMEEFKADGAFDVPDVLMQKARKVFSAYRCDEEKTLAVIRDVFEKTGYILDPHSAVGYAAAREIEKFSPGPVVTLATAHPAKFPDAVEKATGQRPALPPHLSDLLQRKERFAVQPNDLAELKNFVRNQGHS
jgi:threonine synthase